jgi:hypothetical protein
VQHGTRRPAGSALFANSQNPRASVKLFAALHENKLKFQSGTTRTGRQVLSNQFVESMAYQSVQADIRNLPAENPASARSIESDLLISEA